MAISTEIGASIGAHSAGAHGNSIEVRKPMEACLALEMISYGAPYREIKKDTGLSHSNITALKCRHGEAIELRRLRAAEEGEQLATTYREVLKQKAERLLDDEEQLDKLNPKDAALTLGILEDKSMLLRGDPTNITESRKGVSLADAVASIEEARKKVKEEAIDV